MSKSSAMRLAFMKALVQSSVNSSLTRFYNGRTELDFDHDLEQSRSFLRRLYGPDCGD